MKKLGLRWKIVMDSLMVSGGVFLAVVVIPFAGYKLYKKFAGKCGNSHSLFCCTRRRGRNLGNFVKKVVPKVALDFPDNLKVGDVVSFRVIFPLSRHQTLEIVQHQPHSQPSLHESVYLQEEYDLDRLSIDIVKVSGGALAQMVTPIRELLPRTGPEVKEDVLLVKFVVQEAGFYQINVFYEEEHVPGSPFPTPFNAAELDPEKTLCIKESPIVSSVCGELLSLYIRPRDRYGNECNFGDVDTNLFKFRLSQGQQDIGVVVYNFTREIKKILAQYCEPFEETLEVRFEAEIFQTGVFQGTISYNGVVIQNGNFDLVTLSPEEQGILRAILSNNPGSRYHEARLVSLGQEIQKKRQVYLYLNSKSLTIKEFYFAGLIPFRVATFRILPATRVQMLSAGGESGGGGPSTFSICDRIQPKAVVEIDDSDGRVFISVYANYLKQRLGGSESFENKQKFFYEELKTARDVIRATTVVLNIDRAALLSSTMSETKNFSGKDWCRNFKIKFLNEEGSDDGGLKREWLHLLCKEVFDNSGGGDGMFCSMGDNCMLVHPNPKRNQGKFTLKHYELMGKIVGKCLYETAIGGCHKIMVNARFTRSFLGLINGLPPQYKHFEQDDPQLYMSKVKYLLENDVNSMDLTFTEDEYSSTGQLIKTVELIPSGRKITVNNENKEEYLNILAQYRLWTRVKREIEAFLKGLGEIIPDGLLTNFDENELEILMCGRSNFSVEDLKLHHIVSGEGPSYDKMLPWFWIALANMTAEERGRLLQFTTGSSLLPHDGFQGLQPTFRITVYDTSGKLPLAHTCFSELCLSVHRSFEEFEKSLKIAINEGSEGFAIL